MEHVWDEGGPNENSRRRGEDRFEMRYVEICYKIGACFDRKRGTTDACLCFVCLLYVLFVLNRNCETTQSTASCVG